MERGGKERLLATPRYHHSSGHVVMSLITAARQAIETQAIMTKLIDNSWTPAELLKWMDACACVSAEMVSLSL